VGVARPDVSVEEAFCDSSKGWGIYNGEIRHSSNSSGTKYGTAFKENDVIGVYLDMIEVSFYYLRRFFCLSVDVFMWIISKGQIREIDEYEMKEKKEIIHDLYLIFFY